MIAVIVIGILVFILLTLYRKDYGRRVGQKEKEVDNSNKELALLLQQGHMQLWTYDITSGTYSWMDDERAMFVHMQPKDFATHYTPKIYQHIITALQELIRGNLNVEALLQDADLSQWD